MAQMTTCSESIAEAARSFARVYWREAEARGGLRLSTMVAEFKRTLFQMGQERGLTNEEQAELTDVSLRTPTAKRSSTVEVERCSLLLRDRVLDQIQSTADAWFCPNRVCAAVNTTFDTDYTTVEVQDCIALLATEQSHVEQRDAESDSGVEYRATASHARVSTPEPVKTDHLQRKVHTLQDDPDSDTVNLRRYRSRVAQGLAAEFRLELQEALEQAYLSVASKDKYQPGEVGERVTVFVTDCSEDQEGEIQ